MSVIEDAPDKRLLDFVARGSVRWKAMLQSLIALKGIAAVDAGVLVLVRTDDERARRLFNIEGIESPASITVQVFDDLLAEHADDRDLGSFLESIRAPRPDHIRYVAVGYGVIAAGWHELDIITGKGRA